MLLPYKHNVKTITTDNGPEFADHKWLEKALYTKIYFAHPYCSWEKGLIEYTNKLYRQYIPKRVISRILRIIKSKNINIK